MVMKEQDLYVSLRVDGDISRRDLENLLQSGAGGHKDGLDLVIGGNYVHVWSNDSYDPQRRTGDPREDFLYYRWWVDVESTDDHRTVEEQVELTNRMLALLRARGLQVVAACNFEERLDSGGYPETGLAEIAPATSGQLVGSDVA
jgi:hypothetical protein